MQMIIKKYRLSSHGFTLVEVIIVLVILAILTAITVPAVFGLITKANEDVCEANRSELKRTYERQLNLYNSPHSEALFDQHVRGYGDNLCPEDGEMSYVVDEEVHCDTHPLEIEEEEEEDEDDSVPFL